MALIQAFAPNKTRHCVVTRPSPFSPVALKHRERKQACALRHGGLLLRYAPEQRVLVPPTRAGALQESRPWHLGAVSRSRPPGRVP